jgi:6-carboxyhexanoate--CoA ligase
MLSKRLARLGINTDTVKEALVLASKVASTDGVVAELCASDDPGYTTGYVASKAIGYTRLTNIKEKGSPRGGRVFFLQSGADVGGVAASLEAAPALVVG